MRLRPHHISTFIDDRGNKRNYVPFKPYLSAIYGEEFVKSLEDMMLQTTLDTPVEIVSSQDELCNFCPHSEPCKKGDYDTVVEVMSKNSPSYISKYIKDLLSKDNPNLSDKTCILKYGLKIGQTYTFKELCDLMKDSDAVC